MLIVADKDDHSQSCYSELQSKQASCYSKLKSKQARERASNKRVSPDVEDGGEGRAADHDDRYENTERALIQPGEQQGVRKGEGGSCSQSILTSRMKMRGRLQKARPSPSSFAGLQSSSFRPGAGSRCAWHFFMCVRAAGD